MKYNYIVIPGYVEDYKDTSLIYYTCTKCKHKFKYMEFLNQIIDMELSWDKYFNNQFKDTKDEVISVLFIHKFKCKYFDIKGYHDKCTSEIPCVVHLTYYNKKYNIPTNYKMLSRFDLTNVEKELMIREEMNILYNITKIIDNKDKVIDKEIDIERYYSSESEDECNEFTSLI